MRVFLASSNPGKLREYRELAGDATLELELLPNFRDTPAFEEAAPTFAENSAGKALYYSKFSEETVLATIPGWWFRRSAALREYFPPATRGLMRLTRIASENCYTRWPTKKVKSGALISSASP